MLMEIPNENVKRLYAHRLKLNKPVADYLERFPSLADKVKPEPAKELNPEAKTKAPDKPKEVKKHGHKRKKG